MSLPINIITINSFTLLVIIAFACADICHENDPIVNGDFEISCSKSRSPQKLDLPNLSVQILCKTAQPWAHFPSDRLNLNNVNETIFQNCNFPPDLSLPNITESLGLGNIVTLTIVNPQSILSRVNLAGFLATTLNLRHSSFSELPSDLLHEISLKELYIENGRLKSIPEDFFKKSSVLKVLEITSNGLTKLKANDFAGLRNLRELQLFDNVIAEIEAKTFDELTSLCLLELSKNRLQSLPVDVFKKLVKLEKINIGENDFTDLPENLLRIPNSSLTKVRISGNRGNLTSLPNGFLKDLNMVTYVEMLENGFTSLPADLFNGVHSLKSLNISKNRLTTLPHNIFQDTRSLRELWLSRNEIESLPEGIFEYVSLERLYINYNRLTTLPAKVLSGLNHLKLLQLSHNKLKHIGGDCQSHIKSLQYLDISYNELENMDPFLNCIDFIDVNLSYNKISEINPFWQNKHVMKSLDLEGNRITHVDETPFRFLQMQPDMSINLMNNNISTIDLSNIENMISQFMLDNPSVEQKRKGNIYIGNDMLNCDCHLIHLANYFQGKLSENVYHFVTIVADNVRCASPLELRNQLVNNITAEQLKCLVRSEVESDACSGTCTCWNYPARKVLSVDCSMKNLTQLPQEIGNPLNSSIELNMRGNRLQETPSMNYSYRRNVTALDLSSNNISTMSVSVFTPSLRDLRLHNNSLTQVDSKVVQYLDDYGSQHHYSLIVTLYHNKWICDCKIRDFLNVFQRNLARYQTHEARCYDINRSLSNLTVNEVCEGVFSTIILMILMAAPAAFCLIVLYAIYSKYRDPIKAWLYDNQWCLWFVTEDELDKDKEYDAFISYSHRDEQFVRDEIVRRLEEGANPYKLCIHDRDWIAGEWIPDQIVQSVENSRRTIIVLSTNFLESYWGAVEFRTAHNQAIKEGRTRVIVVVYGDISSMNLDEDLKKYVSLNTYVRWGDPWFWNKLRYALPHRNERPRRRMRSSRTADNQLAQLPMNNLENSSVPLPRITNSASLDSARLLVPGADDEKPVTQC